MAVRVSFGSGLERFRCIIQSTGGYPKKALILYDSQYGNTGKIAAAIADALGTPDQVSLKRPAEFDPAALTGLDLLVAGAPTQRLSATPAMLNVLKSLPRNALQGVKVAAFDTRLTWEAINAMPVLPFFVRLGGHRFGFAADPIARLLKSKRGTLVMPPEGFFVQGMEGPLLPAELERAAAWGCQLAAALQG
jgi:flavodoxin